MFLRVLLGCAGFDLFGFDLFGFVGWFVVWFVVWFAGVISVIPVVKSSCYGNNSKTENFQAIL